MTPRRPALPSRACPAQTGGSVGTLGPPDAGRSRRRGIWRARLTRRPDVDGRTGRHRPPRPVVARIGRRRPRPPGRRPPKPIGVRAARSQVLAPPLPPIQPRTTPARAAPDPAARRRPPPRARPTPVEPRPGRHRPTRDGPDRHDPAATSPAAPARSAATAGPRRSPAPTRLRRHARSAHDPARHRPARRPADPPVPARDGPARPRPAPPRPPPHVPAGHRSAATRPSPRRRTARRPPRPGPVSHGATTRAARRRQTAGRPPPASRRRPGHRSTGPSEGDSARRRPKLGGRRRESGWVLLAAVTALLIVIGLMMVLSASSVEALRSYGGAWVFFQRQVDVGGGRRRRPGRAPPCCDYRRWRAAGLAPARRVARPAASLVLVPGVASTSAGRPGGWASASFRFQPSELAKLALLLFAADLLARRADRDARVPASRCARCWWSPASSAAWCMLQPDMGTAMVLVLIVLVVLFVAGMPLLPHGRPCVVGRRRRRRRPGHGRAATGGTGCSSFLDPWADVANTGYQVAQSLVALGTGHAGRRRPRRQPGQVGLPAQRPHRLHLRHRRRGARPGRHPAACVGLFVAFAVLGIRAALRAPDRFGMLLAAGITAWVVGQAFVNMGAVTGLLPVTGVPLPFVSFGGIVAGRDHGRGRHPAQRRPPRRAPAATPHEATPAPGDERHLGDHRRRRHRRPRRARPGRRPGPGRAAATRRRRSTSSAAERGTEARHGARGRLRRSRCCPGRGIQRRLTADNVGARRGA